MEKLKSIPFYKSYGLKVILFLALLMLGVIGPTRIISKSDYHDQAERFATQSSFFYYCRHMLENTPSQHWPVAIKALPRLFFQQRICIFNTERELIFDSGIMKKDEAYRPLRLILPHPYIKWNDRNLIWRPEIYIQDLLGIDTDQLDTREKYRSLRTITYPEGLDRVFVTGQLMRSADDEELIFTMSQSVVDILMQTRAIKERFLILYSSISLAALVLGIILTLSVTKPLKKLYHYSLQLQSSKWKEINPARLPARGEIGFICRALQSQIRDQKIQADNFREFSSDITHELKTPLAAIRSGLDVYTESNNKEQKTLIMDRIMRRISRMEDLINRIHFIGNLETATEDELCCTIDSTVSEALADFTENEITVNISPRIKNSCIKLSERKLRQLLEKLLENAVSFSPEKQSVSLSLQVQGKELQIVVSDKGPGIAAEAFNDICSRFYSYRPQNKELHSGLGLAIVDAALRSCGGSLEYHNREKGGAGFKCLLPLAKPDNQE